MVQDAWCCKLLSRASLYRRRFQLSSLSVITVLRRTACKKNSLILELQGGLFDWIKQSGKLHRSWICLKSSQLRKCFKRREFRRASRCCPRRSCGALEQRACSQANGRTETGTVLECKSASLNLAFIGLCRSRGFFLFTGGTPLFVSKVLLVTWRK